MTKDGVDFGPEGGVDLAWIFWGREKRPEKIRGDFGTKFVTKFVTKCVTKFVPVSSKIRDRIRATKSKIHGELPPYFCVLSSRTERPPENALSTQGKDRIWDPDCLVQGPNSCFFPYRFSGKNRNSGLVPGNRDPKIG